MSQSTQTPTRILSLLLVFLYFTAQTGAAVLDKRIPTASAPETDLRTLLRARR